MVRAPASGGSDLLVMLPRQRVADEGACGETEDPGGGVATALLHDNLRAPVVVAARIASPWSLVVVVGAALVGVVVAMGWRLA